MKDTWKIITSFCNNSGGLTARSDLLQATFRWRNNKKIFGGVGRGTYRYKNNLV